MSKIYVLIPVYNAERYLKRCIESVLNQTYTNFEIILVDDGSQDSSASICDYYATKYEKITVIHQNNGGVSVARNVALEYVRKKSIYKDEWITFVDSDDFVHPCYLEYMYHAVRETGGKISSCCYSETDCEEINYENELHFQYHDMLVEEYWCRKHNEAIVVWGSLYSVYLFDNVTFPIGKIAEDASTTYKVLFKCEKVTFVPIKLYFYFLSDNSIMRSLWSPQMLDELDSRKEHIAYFEENGFSKAYELAVRELFLASIKHLRYMNNYAPKCNYLKKQVRTICCQAYRLYAKEVGNVKAFKFWYEARILRPMKRVLQNRTLLSVLTRRVRRYIAIK